MARPTIRSTPKEPAAAGRRHDGVPPIQEVHRVPLGRSTAATMVEALGDCGVDLVAVMIDVFDDLGQLDDHERAA